MLLRSSISTTKKFFHKTLHNVKSFFSGGYRRLPKIPPHTSDSCSVAACSVFDVKNNRAVYKDSLDSFCIDFTGQWGSQQDKPKGSNQKQVDSSYSSKGISREQKNCVVVQKLKELEMVDKGNVEFVLDIEEVLHYYSRLTCPAYLEMVDKFFTDMYPELFAPHTRPPSPGAMNSVSMQLANPVKS